MSLLQILFLALNLSVNVAYFETSENITTLQEEQPSRFQFFEKKLEPRILVAEKKGKRRRGEEESEEKTTMITNII